MKQIYNILLLILTITVASKTYSQEGAIYNSSTTGTLGGVAFTMSNINNSSIENYNLSDSNFSSDPLSNSQPCLDFSYNSEWSITFASPINNLRLYCKYWRTMQVSFNHSFAILSGSNLQNPSGNQLNTVASSNGIIEFSEPITTLTLTILGNLPGGTQQSKQAMTFGINSALSIDNFGATINRIMLYPNPSKEFIQLSGLTKSENYKIYNIIGSGIADGKVTNNEKIEIKNLTDGIYFLKFDDGNTLKFIKE